MLLCSSRVLALRGVSSLLFTAAITAFAPAAAAQTTPPAAGTAAPKKADPKKADPKKTEAAPATAATPAATESTTPAAAPAADEPTKEDKRAVYLSLDIGFSRVDVGGISDNTGFDKTAANGLLASFGAGYRQGDFRLGARFRDSSTTELSLWSLVGEVGYGLPFRPVSPVVFVHAGYMFSNGVERGAIASSLPAGNVLTPSAQLDGLVVGGELVASVWLTKFLRVGPFVGVDFAWLHRSQLALPQSIVPLGPETRNNALFNDSGSGVGYVLNLGIRGTGDVAF